MRIERAAQCFSGVPDLAFAGQEHQHIAGRLVRQLVHRVDDGFGLIAHLGPDDFVVGVVGILGRRRSGRGTSSGR